MKRRIVSWIATCGPIGYLKWAPGTFGSLVGIPLILLISRNAILFTLVFVLLFVTAVWTSGEVARDLKQHDPQTVVIDEVCGMILSLFLIRPTGFALLIGFICFRIFDVIKPVPLRWLERFPNGFGIVLDDLGAGIYANIILHVLVHYAHL